MLDKIFYFIMVPMVYAAFAIFIIGIIYSVVKVLTNRKHPSTLQIFPK